VHCFGDQILTAQIDSPDLDWRARHDIAVAETKLDCATEKQVRKLLAELGLRMGVIDLKLDRDGVPYWLELNSQGQFLFVEALSGMPLARACAEFLVGLADC